MGTTLAWIGRAELAVSSIRPRLNVATIAEDANSASPPPRGSTPKRFGRRTTMRYTVVLEQEEDGGYVASVPALPGCVSQGNNRAEALSNIREAIELYVDDCRDAGDSIPTEAGKEFVEIEAA
jgi:predicted RNase H-like HicB family nuclease